VKIFTRSYCQYIFVREKGKRTDGKFY